MPAGETLLCDYTATYYATPTTNNVTEYDGLTKGLCLARDLGYTHLTIFGN
jgi:ribonuclease HI